MAETCIICKSELIKHYHKYFKFPVIVCQNCGFIKAKETPDIEKLKKYYSKYSYLHDPGIDAITKIRYQELLKRISPFRKTNKILDFGCGLGHFLEVARNMNWDVVGLEFSENAINLLSAKNIPTYYDNIPQSEYGQYDAIICIEVLEHVSDPIYTINIIKNLLRTGGCLYLSTPNIRSLSLTYLKNKDFFIAYPEHLNYFTVKSFKKILQDSFTIGKVKTTGIIPFRKTESKNDEINIKDIDRIKIKVESKLILKIAKSLINFFLSLIQSGDTIKIWAIKR